MNLEPNDYWKLRAINSDLERDQASLMAIQSRIEVSRIRREQMWKEIAQKYNLDPNKPYQAKDEDCSLTNGNEN